jgi:hypothetical protein
MDETTREPGSSSEERESRSDARGRRQRRPHHRRRHACGGSDRKERVLHTRISEQLSDDIRRLAEDMRVPVSNLVRNVLEEVFTTVESVSGDVGDFFEEVLDEAEGVRERLHARPRSRSRRRRGSRFDPVDVEEEMSRDEDAEQSAKSPAADGTPEPDFSHVLAWQPVVLNQPTRCGACRVRLEAGANAFLATPVTGDAAEFVCPRCVAD